MNYALANAILPFCGALTRDKGNRPTAIVTPAHADRESGAGRYAVVSVKASEGEVRVSCRCFLHGAVSDEGEACKSADKVCYHSLAALNFRAGEAGGTIRIYGVNNSGKAEADAAKSNGVFLSVFVGNNSERSAVAVFFPPARPAPKSEPAPVKPPKSEPAQPARKFSGDEYEAIERQAALEAQVRSLSEKLAALTQPTESKPADIVPVCQPEKGRKRGKKA